MLNAGMLDPAFGTGGLVTTDLGGLQTVDGAVLQTVNNTVKIVVAGTTTPTTPANSDSIAYVARYNPDGSLDATFGDLGPASTTHLGWTQLDLGPGADDVGGVALTPDNKIVLAGRHNIASGAGHIAVARLNSDGTRDASFGSGVIDPSLAVEDVSAVMVQPDGNILICGNSIFDSTNTITYVARIHGSGDVGSLDTSFGDRAHPGIQSSQFFLGTQLGSLALDNAGNILVAGKVPGLSGSLFALWRLDAAGSPDSTFGISGKVFSIVGNSAQGEAVAVDPSTGKIVLTGTVTSSTVTPNADDFGVARYRPTGTLDGTFGAAGAHFFASTTNDDAVSGVALQADGKILIAGKTEIRFPDGNSHSDFQLVRVTKDGNADVTFGNDGFVTTNFAGAGKPSDDEGHVVLVQPDGDVVVAGTASGKIGLARYTGSSSASGAGPGIPLGTYIENFSDRTFPGLPSFDSTGTFEHLIGHFISNPADVHGAGYDINVSAQGGHELSLNNDLDTITFPVLASDEEIEFAKVDVSGGTLGGTAVKIIGKNGVYVVPVPAGTSAIVSVGFEHLLPNGLELGPIREIALFGSTGSSFRNVTVLVATAISTPPPRAVSVFKHVLPEVLTAIDVLANDQAADGGPLTIASVTTPGHGTATIAAGVVNYKSTTGYSGVDHFEYTIRDQHGSTATATVTLTVHTPPPASDHTFRPAHGSRGSFSQDAPGVLENYTGQPPQSITVVDQPALGSVVFNHTDGSFTYTRTGGGLIQADHFTYKINDGIDDSNLARVDLAPVNTPPPNPVDASITIQPRTRGPLNIPIALLQDGDRDRLTPDVVTQPTFGHVSLNTDGSFTYTPNAGPNALVLNDSFTYALNDGYVDSTPATVHLVVMNHAPVANDSTFRFSETQIVDGQLFGHLSATLGDGDQLTFFKVQDPQHGGLIVNPNGDFTYTPGPMHGNFVAAPNGTFVWAPPHNYLDTFTFQVSDNYLARSNTATLTLEDVAEVHPTLSDAGGVGNRATINSALFYSDGFDSRNIDVYFDPFNFDKLHDLSRYVTDDPDRGQDQFTFRVVDNPTYGTVTMRDDGTFVYRPRSAPSIFIDNNHGGPPPATTPFGTRYRYQVTAVADPVTDSLHYVMDGPPNMSIDPDTGLLLWTPRPAQSGDSPIPVTVTVTDSAGNATRLHFAVNPPQDPALPPVAQQPVPPPVVDSTPVRNRLGPDQFTFVANDGLLDSTLATIYLNIGPSGLARADSYTVSQDGTLRVDGPGLFANDLDFMGLPLANGPETTLYEWDFESSGGARHGQVHFDNAPNSGGFTYTPNPGFHGVDELNYAVVFVISREGGVFNVAGVSNTARVVIHVTPSNGQPENVVSLSDAVDGSVVTLASSPGTFLQSVQASNISSISDPPPPGVSFPFGLVKFEVAGLQPIDSTTVTLTLPDNAVAELASSGASFTYYKYGATPDLIGPGDIRSSPTPPHWYAFSFDGRTGAETHHDNPQIPTNQIVLHFVDGERGDDDALSDGVIQDPGGIAILVRPDVGFVVGLYRTLLSRFPETAGLTNWVSQLDGGVSRLQVVEDIYNSPEHRGIQVDQFYATYLHRAPEPAGRLAWMNAFLAGLTETAAARAFLLSPEYTAAHANAASFVSGLYHDALGRAPDPVGQSLSLGFLEQDADDDPSIKRRAAIALVVLTSQEAYVRCLDHFYAAYLQRLPDPVGLHNALTLLQSRIVNPEQVGEIILASEEFFARARDLRL